MKFQFNKTELQNINRQLKVRVQALPTLKNKESALRAEIKKHKDRLKQLQQELLEKEKDLTEQRRLFAEFDPHIIELEKVEVLQQKIAGVKIPSFKDAVFKINEFSLYNRPLWFLDGAELLKVVAMLKIRMKVEEKRIQILEHARKKTTQKVNLYEKVQIPEFQEATIKIKRFLADEENLDRSGQKIIKKKKVAVV